MRDLAARPRPMAATGQSGASTGWLRRKTHNRGDLVVIGFVLVAATVASVWTPWPLIAVVGGIIALAAAPWTSWSLRVALPVVLLAAGAALLARVTPFLGIPLAASAPIFLLAIGAVGLAVAAHSPRELRSWRTSRSGALAMVSVAAVPGATLAVILLASQRGTLGLSWAMRNDAVWNAVTARLVISDAGLLPAHPNASPLTSILLAVAAAPGRAWVVPANLLSHDISRFAELWVFAAVGSSVLAGLIVVRAAAGRGRVLTVLAGVAGSVIPLTWYCWGAALDLGFYNATLILLILLATWIAWIEFQRSPRLALIATAAAGVGALAAWAPLAIIPAAFLLVEASIRFRTLPGTRPRRIIVTFGYLLPIVAYALAFTLLDLTQSGKALASGGATVPISATATVVTIAVTTAVIVFREVRSPLGSVMLGAIILVSSGGVGLGYLLFQRRGLATLWGYYPIKMAWLVMSVLLVIALASVVASAGDERGRPLRQLAVLGLGSTVIVALMWQNPGHLGRSLLPVVSIVTASGVSGSDPAANTLFDLARPHERIMAVRYRGEATDQFVNGWLLQLNSTSATEPIRNYSYFLDPADDSQVCAAIRSWHAHVVVVTADPGLAGRLSTPCEGADYRVELRG